jgi:hypothetical protein
VASLATADAILLAETFPAIATIEHSIIALPQRHIGTICRSGTTISIKYANIQGKKRSITVPMALTHNPLPILKEKGLRYLRIILKLRQPSEAAAVSGISAGQSATSNSAYSASPSKITYAAGISLFEG